MHIALTLTYTHDNDLPARLFERIAALSPVAVSCFRDGDLYTLEASGDEAPLKQLVETASALIPQSLFLHAHTLDAVETRRVPAPYTATPAAPGIPYCLECQHTILQTLDPFGDCPVCGDADLAFETPQSPEAFFMDLAGVLKTTGTLRLQTYNGVRTFSIREDASILICDPQMLPDTFIMTPGELEAMQCIEKPAIRLKPKLPFRMEHALSGAMFPVFLPDDKITLALSEALRRQGIAALFCDRPPMLRVAVSAARRLIVGAGRDLLPWRHDTPVSTAAFCDTGDTEAFADSDGIRVDRHVEPQPPCLHYLTRTDPREVANAVRFEPAHAAIRSVVLEHGLEEKRLYGVYLSRRFPMQICAYSAKTGYSPIVAEADPIDPAGMIQAIATMNDNGARLVTNASNAFPKLMQRLQNTPFDHPVPTLAAIWATAAIALERYDGTDPIIACETLEGTSIECSSKSGPRMDYRIMTTPEGDLLDPRVGVRSVLSFKLADVDVYMLSLGMIDSLADFIADQAEKANQLIGIEGIVLAGDFFENRQLLTRTLKTLGTQHPIYTNERLGIDGSNLAAGAVTLGA